LDTVGITTVEVGSGNVAVGMIISAVADGSTSSTAVGESGVEVDSLTGAGVPVQAERRMGRMKMWMSFFMDFFLGPRSSCAR
jgi:hypothetical protein